MGQAVRLWGLCDVDKNVFAPETGMLIKRDATAECSILLRASAPIILIMMTTTPTAPAATQIHMVRE